jgi:hypothetical protein
MWLALLSCALAAVPDAPQSHALGRLLHKLGDLPPGPERTVRATELLLGYPYELHPLG